MGRPVFFTPDDFSGRYAVSMPTMVSSPAEGGTVADREKQLISDIGRGDGTALKYVVDLPSSDNHIVGLLESGRIEEARRLREERNNVIDVNRRDFEYLSGIRNAGKTGEGVAANAGYAVRGDFDRREVTVFGKKTTVGAVLGAGSTFLADNTAAAKESLGVDEVTAGMYYGAKGYDDLDRRMTKTAMDELSLASAKPENGPAQNHLQLKSLLHSVAANRDRLRSTFGSRAGDIVDFVIADNKTSGGHSYVLESMLKLGSNMGTSPEDVADRIISSYSDLRDSVASRDSNGKMVPMDGDHKRLFDSALYHTLRYTSDSKFGLDFNNERFRSAFRQAYNEFDLCMNYGVDLFREAKDGSGTPAQAIGEYVGRKAMGLGNNSGNIISNMRALRTGLSALIQGADDFEPATGELTSESRGTVRGRLGGSSTSPALDALCSEAQGYLLRELTPYVVKHQNIGNTMRKLMLSRSDSRRITSELASYFLPSFQGPGAKATAQELSTRVLKSLMSGKGINLQAEMTEMANPDGDYGMAHPSVVKTLGGFLGANVLDGEMKGMRTALVHHGVSCGMSEPVAQGYATSQISTLHGIKRAGGNYKLQFNRLLMSGPYYYELKDPRNGAVVMDEVTGLPSVNRDFVNFDDVSGGRFSMDPDYAAKVRAQQQPKQKIYFTNIEAREKAALVKAKESGS